LGPFCKKYTGLLNCFNKTVHFQSKTIVLLKLCILPRTLMLSCTATDSKKIKSGNCIGILYMRMFYSESPTVKFACDRQQRLEFAVWSECEECGISPHAWNSEQMKCVPLDIRTSSWRKCTMRPRSLCVLPYQANDYLVFPPTDCELTLSCT
jgi:hypothetical protein